jgi:hypothetical protein
VLILLIIPLIALHQIMANKRWRSLVYLSQRFYIAATAFPYMRFNFLCSTNKFKEVLTLALSPYIIFLMKSQIPCLLKGTVYLIVCSQFNFFLNI